MASDASYVCRTCVIDAQRALHESTFPLHRTPASDERLMAVASVVAMQANVGSVMLKMLQDDSWDTTVLEDAEVAFLIQLVDEAGENEPEARKPLEAVQVLARLNPSAHRGLTADRSLVVLRRHASSATMLSPACQLHAVQALAWLAAGSAAGGSAAGRQATMISASGDFAPHLMSDNGRLKEAGAVGVAHLTYHNSSSSNSDPTLRVADIDPLFEVPDSDGTESEITQQAVVCAIGNLLINSQTRGDCISKGGFRRLEKIRVKDAATETLRNALLSHAGSEGPPPSSPPPIVVAAEAETNGTEGDKKRSEEAEEKGKQEETKTVDEEKQSTGHNVGDSVAGHSVLLVDSLKAGGPVKYFSADEDERNCLVCDTALGTCGAVQLLEIDDEEDVFVHSTCFKCSRKGCPEVLTDLYWLVDDELVCGDHFQELVKFVCDACQCPIETTFLRAMDKLWHPDHFVCTTCKISFEDGYYKHESKPYCEQHVAEVMGIKCAKCDETVVGGVKALGRAFHEHCFACFECDKPFSDQEGFYRHGRDPFCKACVKRKRKEDPLCAKCDQPLANGSSETVVSALSKKWHSECFVCNTCGVNVEKIGFYGRDGLPYCAEHSEEVCGACHKPLSGTAFAALNKKFHPACFKCGDCDAPFTSDQGFYEVDGLPYCELHAIERSKNVEK